MAEKVEIIDIDAKNAMRTLKDLKDEVKELRKALDNCEIGSDEFTDTLNQLTDAQTELKNATKSSTEVIEGSYDALVKKMSELKKEWRATADELKRNDLGKEISDINKQLKDMDAELGNYQRNVGNYGSAFEGVTLKFEDGVGKFEKLNTVSQDVIGSFDVIEGGLKAMGVESEFVSGMMDKLAGAMKMTQGFKSVTEGVDNFKALKAAVTANTIALSGFKKALIATGIGAAIVAVATLIAYWDDLTAAIKGNTKELKENNALLDEFAEKERDRHKKVVESIADTTAQYKILQNQWRQLTTEQEKSKWLIENKNKFDALGLSVKSLTDADRIFVEQSANVIQMLKMRAKATALSSLLVEEYKRKELAQFDKQNQTVYGRVGYTPTEDEIKQWGLDDDKADYFDDNGALNTTGSYKAYNREKSRNEAIISDADSAINNITNQLNKINSQLMIWEDTYGISTTTSTTTSTTPKTTSSTSTAGKTDEQKAEEEREKQIKDIITRLKEFSINTKQEELDELKKKYDEELKLLGDNEEAKQQLKEEYEANQKAIEDKYNEPNKILLEQYKALQDEIVMSQMNSSAQQLEIIKNQYEQEKKLLDELKEKKLITEEEYADAIYDIDMKRKTAEEQITDVVEEEKEVYGELGLEIKKTGLLTADNQKLIARSIDVVSETFAQTSQLLTSLANSQDQNTKQGFENYKNLSIAAAVMSMLQGIIGAWTSAMSLPAPFSFITGGIMSAFTATMGALQIDQIKKQKFGGNNSGSNGHSSNITPPTINTGALMSSPVSYISEIQGANATSDATDNRVYVVESDISDTQKKVSVAEEEATF